MTARDEVLARIRQANAAAGVIVGDTNQVVRDTNQVVRDTNQVVRDTNQVVGDTNYPGAAASYRTQGDRSLAERLDLLAGRLVD